MRSENASQRVALSISSQNDANRSYKLKDVRTVKNLNLPQQSLNVPELSERYPHLKGIPLASYQNVQPTILIGADHTYVSVPTRTKEGGPNEPVAFKTRLGWTILGQTSPYGKSVNTVNIHVCSCQNLDDNVIVKKTAALQEPDKILATTLLETTTKRVRDRKRIDQSVKGRWFNRPDFLHEPEHFWPHTNSELIAPDDDVIHEVIHQTSKEPFIDVKRFSKWNRSLRTTAFVHRFIDKLRHKGNNANFLASSELSQAETTLVLLALAEAFSAKRQLLKDGKQVSDSSSLYTLSPFVDDDGLMRLESRIENALVPLDVRRPILLQPQHHITELVVQQYHENNLINTNDIAAQLTEKELTWHFNPPLAPHMGEAWEHMVQTVKKALLAALPQRNPTDEVLRSARIEVEAVVNNRPLTYIPVENTHRTAITPNDFLGILQPERTSLVPNDTLETLVKNFGTSQVIAIEFWKRWLHEYLPELTRRNKWHEELPNLKKGDIVNIVDPSSKRGDWSKGVVKEVKVSSDGRVRTADVRTATGLKKRPVSKLVPLIVKTSWDSDKLRPLGGSVKNNDDPA